MDASLIDIIDLISRGGTVTLLTLAIVGGFRKWYVWGWQYEEVKAQREQWREMFLRSVSSAERTLHVTEKVVKAVNGVAP